MWINANLDSICAAERTKVLKRLRKLDQKKKMNTPPIKNIVNFFDADKNNVINAADADDIVSNNDKNGDEKVSKEEWAKASALFCEAQYELALLDPAAWMKTDVTGLP